MTDLTGTITKAAERQKTAVAIKTPAQRMQDIVSNPATVRVLENSLKENAGAYAASIIDLYNSDKTLQMCEPSRVMAECLKAVSLKLPINKQLGFAYIIPYGGTPTFILGYRGLLQLCMRTGAYRHINAGPVYEGELRMINKLTGDIDLDGEATSEKIIGYFAYIETLNGFSKAIYWPTEKVVTHARKYSKNYGGAIWKDNFEEMATKSVLRHLLSHWGVMSVDMQTAMSAENTEAADSAIVADLDHAIIADPVTGEILPDSDVNGGQTN
jgi:recombination protein RecT